MSEKTPKEAIATAKEDSNTFQEMHHIQTLIGMSAYPVDYMIDNGAPIDLFEQYMAKRNIRLAEAVAKITGGNIEDIANKDKRTPEQERLMMEISGKDQMVRLERFLKSDYALTQDIIRNRYKSSMAAILQNRYKGRKAQDIDYFAEKMEKITDKETIAIQHIALYFFAMHKDIDPRKSGGIGEKEKAELLSYLDKALKILESKSKNPRLSFAKAVDESIGIKKTITKKTAAKAVGAITEIYERSLSITDKDYQYALTPHPNSTAYIAPLDDDFMKKLVFKDGEISFLDKEMTISEADVKKAANGRKMELVKELDIQLLRSLFTAIYHNAESINGGNVSVYMPAFCKSMGIDMATGKPNDILGKVNQFRNCVGCTKNGSFYTLLNFSKYDVETNTITFDSPYMNMIIKQIQEGSIQTLPNGKTYPKPAYSYLVHSNMANERNKAAVEIVHIIIALLHQRGNISDEKIAKGSRKKTTIDTATNPTVTAHKKYATIINEIPLLQERIKGGTANASNAQLKRAFSKAFELLNSKTDAYKYFIDLKIPQMIPTVTMLNKPLKITHKGINPNYESKK